MTIPDAAKDLAIDGVKAAPLAAYGVSTMNGIDWTIVGAFLMAIYAATLVIEKGWKFWKWLQPRLPKSAV